ncbi:MAG: hypothetical protein APF76_10460 [Desulfitibacter sp. BRH_c19]|nr:MAG: hypothetical protein APF76_10460 [Desulfitibacter sp. BRH_c19]
MNSLLKKAFSFLVITVLLMQIPTMAYASWGLQRILDQQNQATTSAPVTTQPPKDTQVTTPAPSSNQSTADYIRNLRRNPTTQQNNANPTPSNPSPSNPRPETPPSNQQGAMTSSESMMLNLINKERSEKGLKPLQWHSGLAGLARLKSQDMVDNNYFAHNSPTYGSFYHMVSNAGISYRQVGENLAKARDVSKAHVLLMASEGHRNNILSSHFTHIGVGILSDRYGIVATQLFIAQ